MRAIALLACATLLAGCAREGGERLPAAAEARLPTSLGALWALCPVPDIPQRTYDRWRSQASRETEALIREVRRRPDRLVTSAHMVPTTARSTARR